MHRTGFALRAIRALAFCLATLPVWSQETLVFGPQLGHGPIDLVVLATVRPVPNEPGTKAWKVSDWKLQLDVEEVLAGFTDQTTLWAKEDGHSIEDGIYGHVDAAVLRTPVGPDAAAPRLILKLARDRDDDDGVFDVEDAFAADELAAQRAVIAAEIDNLVLSAEVAFVGHALPWKRSELLAAAGRQELGPWGLDDLRLVEIEEVLHGRQIQAGDRVLVAVRSMHNLDGKVRERTESLVYLGYRCSSDPKCQPLVYFVRDALYPPQLVPQFKEVLARRETFPLAEHFNVLVLKPVLYREIVFSGPSDEAVALLGSSDEEATNFGARRLVHNGEPSLALLSAEIDRELTAPAPDGFQLRRQANLIKVLAAMATTSTAAGELLTAKLDRLMGAIEADTPPPRWPADFQAGQYREIEAKPDANHSLAWLLERADVSTLMERFATRLTRLRDAGPAGWRPEVQLALDLAGVDDRLELTALAPAMAGLKSVHSQPGFAAHGSGQVEWSPDGRYLAGRDFVDWRVWNTADWSMAARLKTSEWSQLAFAADGDSVYLFGQDTIQRADWRTGQVLQEFPQQPHTESFAFSSDDSVMVTGSQHRIVVWKLPEGEIVREIDAPWLDARFALQPGGKLLIHQVSGKDAATRWMAEFLDDRQPPVEFVATAVRFSPDGRLFTLQKPWKNSADPKAWRRRRTYGDFALLDASEATALMLVNRQSEMAQADAFHWFDPEENPGPSIRVFAFAEDRGMARFVVSAQSDSSDGQFALSPDGQSLAVGAALWGPPRLFRVATGQRVLPGDRHAGHIESLQFSADGQTLESFGDDGLKVRWNPATMEPLGREARPKSLPGEPVGEDDKSPPRLMPDGKHYFEVEERGDPRTDRSARLVLIDAADKKRTELGKIELPWAPFGGNGLVSGGKYFHVGTQIYDLTSLELVAARRFDPADVLSIHFTGDGSRYAIVTWADEKTHMVGQGLLIERHHPGESTVILRVQETLSGKTVAAFEDLDSAPYGLAFSPDGKRLAGIHHDGTIEVWPLP